jgi:30S ribosomal protein S31
MGKGDRKSKKGKIAKGSFGVTRIRKPAKSQDMLAKPPKVAKKPAKKTVTEAKKTTVKKKETKKEEK